MIPQLLLGHFIADYPAQTDWIFRSKLAGWPGLLMHGGVVLVAQASAVFPNTLALAPLLLGMVVVHVVQDRIKIVFGDKLFKGMPVVPYLLDQALHIVLIMFISPRMVRVVGQQPANVKWTATLMTALVVLTWTYYISWRVVVGNDHPYPVEWRWTGKLERTLALVAGLLNLVWLAPLAVIPRLIVAWMRGVSITQERYLIPDALLGIVLSAAAGFVIIHYVRI